MKEARPILEVESTDTLRAWAERGILKHKKLPNGQIRLNRMDVMEKASFLRGLGNDDVMTPQEMGEAFSKP